MLCKRQRDRLPDLVNIGHGKHAPFTGRRGWIPNVRFEVLGNETRPGRSEFVPFVVTRNAQLANPAPARQAVFPSFNSDIANHDTVRTAAANRRKRRREDNEQESMHWQEALPEHLFRRTCALANEPRRRLQVQEQMLTEFGNRVASACVICYNCNSADHVQQTRPAKPIIFAGIHAHITVDKPEFQCNKCSAQIILHPLSLDSFPATPRRATVWYDNQLLVVTSAAQHSGPTAIQAHCAALQQLYLFNGCGPGAQAIWRHLATASRNWLRLEVTMQLLQLLLH